MFSHAKSIGQLCIKHSSGGDNFLLQNAFECKAPENKDIVDDLGLQPSIATGAFSSCLTGHGRCMLLFLPDVG